MTLEILKKHCIPRVVYALTGDKRFNHDDLLNIRNCIIYGDPGADTFIKIASDENNLTELLKSHLDGDTNCGFTTEISLIIKNGEAVKVSSFFK